MTPLSFRADSRLAPEHREHISQKLLEPFVRHSSQGVAGRLSDWLPSVIIPPRQPLTFTVGELTPESDAGRKQTFTVHKSCRCCSADFVLHSPSQRDCQTCIALISEKLRRQPGRVAWSVVHSQCQRARRAAFERMA